ncbi:ankyrin repeat domain-containing protein [Dinoroseobacter sp. S375]|uniref:ankyrin repeat domain-containing protein n=1 Tax=Dinoroseobacter sp. S375 TaxID=3415136 RepID=UPI003C7DA7BB
MVKLRRMASSIFEDMNRQGGRSLGIHIYKYEDAELEDTDSKPIQELICRPDDKLSEGLVAFFGEKIGKDLHSNSDKGMLSDLPDLISGIKRNGKRYRLVHPWIDGAEEDGGFPLTGSTFEVLCAIAGQARLDAQGSERRLPSFLCFASPKEVLEFDDAEDAPWGNDQLWDDTYAQLRKQKKKLRQAQDELSLQRQMLANFAQYLNLSGHELRFIPQHDEIEEAYRYWLRNNGFTGSHAEVGTNPFLGLRSYDVKDHASYFGREDEVEAAVSLIERAFDTPDAPQFYWVKGSSGVGKSSFLRAGIIGELVTSFRVTGRYSQAVFRPNQLLSKAALSPGNDPLKALFDLAITAIHQTFYKALPGPDVMKAQSRAYDSCTQEARGAFVVDTLDRLVAESQSDETGQPHRLILGIDQFEEIVDMLHDRDRKAPWASFVDFIVQAPAARHIFVAATLRERRLQKMQEHPKLAPLWDRTSCHEYDLKVPSAKDLRGIMMRPFEIINHSYLADDLLSHLLAQVRRIESDEKGRYAGRVMPLVSLVLEQIHLEVGEPGWKKKHEKTATPQGPDGQTDASADMQLAAARQGYDTSPVKITLAAAKQHADLDGVISKLAELAMQEAKQKNALKTQESTLDDLLRKLVRWAGGGAEEDTQFSLPAIQMPSTGDEALLARALRKYRLLMDEGEGKVRLVHETVLKKWPEAAEFMERERPLYRLAQEMEVDARRWKEGRALDTYQVAEHGSAACDLLGRWIHRFNTYFTPEPEPKDAMLRDFCLAVLHEVSQPREIVQKSRFKTPRLHLAALYGRADILRKMLSTDPEAVDITREDGRTALIAPCFNCNHEVLDTLLEFGAKADIEVDDGYYPIHFAAIGGEVAFTQKLIKAGAIPRDQPCHPIHLAASHGRSALVEFYLDSCDTPPDVRDKSGWTPTMFAASQGQCTSLDRLIGRADLNTSIDPDAEEPFGMTALHIAAANGALDFVKALVEAGVPVTQPNAAGATALHFAVLHGHPVTASYLTHEMARGDAPGPNTKMNYAWDSKTIVKIRTELEKPVPNMTQLKLAEWTALHVAVEKNDTRCLKALLEAGADPNTQNRRNKTPLHMAIEKEHAECVDLLARVTDLTLRDTSNDTPLQAAVRRDDLSAAMLIAGNDPARKFDYVHRSRVTDTQKLTLLHDAVAEDFDNLTRFLLNSDLPEDLRDVFGRTPLHVAAANGQMKQLSILLSHGAFDHSATDGKGLTALELACLAGRFRSASVLLDAWGGDALVTDCPEALHMAARGGPTPIAQKLVKLGYPVDGYDRRGLTPLMIAAQYDHHELVAWLLSEDSVIPQRPMRDRDEITAHTLATLAGAESSLAQLIENTGVKSLPLAKLVWQAVEHGQFDCAALLLTASGDGDITDPVTQIPLSVYYSGQRARQQQVLPKVPLAPAARLEEILFPQAPPEAETPAPAPAPPPTGQDKASARDDTAVKPAPAPVPRVRPPKSGTVDTVTQSRKHGLASDVYAHHDRKKALWQPVAGEELAAFIEKINPVDGRYKLNLETVECHRRSLPWYDTVELIQLRDKSLRKPKLALCYLRDGENLFRLNGTSPPIHEVNAKAPVKINEQNVADYLRYFCFFVRGEEGPFYVLEDAADPLLSIREPTLRSVVEGTARPLSFDGMNPQGDYLVNAVIYYSNAIFIAQFAVQPGGMVRMVEDEPIAADLPFKLDCPLS